jgi:hypothetical protein
MPVVGERTVTKQARYDLGWLALMATGVLWVAGCLALMH